MKPPPSLQAYRENRQADQADDGTLVKYRGLRSMLARLLFLVPTAGLGLRVTMGQDGPVWSTTNGSTTAPLYVSGTGRVTAGTVGGKYPTIGGTSIADNPAPLLSIPTSGTRHVCLNITLTLSKDGTTYVTGFSAVNSVTLTVESTDPGSAGLKSSTGKFVVKLATFVDGVKTAQTYEKSLNLSVCDNGSASGTAEIVLD